MPEGYNTQITLKIDWGDLDLFGHVNNVAFFKYIQAARVNYCESIGLTAMDEPGKLSFIVASSTCNFKIPLRYPGEIFIFSKIEWIKNTSFRLSHLLLNQNNTIAAEAFDVVVVFDYAKKSKAGISDILKEKMEQREGRKLVPVIA